MSDRPNPLLHYERHNGMVRVTLRSLTNHELREVLVGLWARLDPADRMDHITALQHYHTDPEAWFSPVAQAVKDAGEGRNEIDVNRLVRQEHGT